MMATNSDSEKVKSEVGDSPGPKVCTTHSINLGLKPSKNNRLPKFTPGLTYDVNIPKIWVQFFCLHGLARKCHFCILTMLNQLISGLKKKF